MTASERRTRRTETAEDEPESGSLVITRRRVITFAVAVVVLAAIAVGYSIYAVNKDRARYQGSGTGPVNSAADLGITGSVPRILFRDTQPGPGYGDLATVPAADPSGPRMVTGTSCDRVYAAAGTVLCLVASHGLVTDNTVEVMNADLQVQRTLDLGSGSPSRARISADGRMASWTIFTVGDSYNTSNFSTRTSILDTRTGQYVATLEDFTMYKDGQVYMPIDRNFWGVTMSADDNTFYATMSTLSDGVTYLVRGDVAKKTLTVLIQNVECPSLSPDGTRIVFKKRVGPVQQPWRLYVLDLATMTEKPLAETRSVDDQAAWIDDDTMAYAVPTSTGIGSDLWSVPADGTGAPHLLIPGAFSPAPVG